MFHQDLNYSRPKFKFDYQEVKKRDGSYLVFVRFSELLKANYEVEEIESFRRSDGKFICNCPFCKSEGHTKEKLYIREDDQVGFCFVCNRTYINVSDEVKVSMDPLKLNVPKFKDKLEIIPMGDPEWNLDKFYEDFDEISEDEIDYLNKRHRFLGEGKIYEHLGFRSMDGNIVMPFYYGNDIIYYQIRFTKNNRIKYFFPPMPTGKKPPYVLENGNCKRIIICEGVYDAIALLLLAPEYTPFAVLGSNITDYQLDFLREYMPEEIAIYMDETSISQKIKDKVKSRIDYAKVWIYKSSGEDPEEHLKRRLKWCGYDQERLKTIVPRRKEFQIKTNLNLTEYGNSTDIWKRHSPDNGRPFFKESPGIFLPQPSIQFFRKEDDGYESRVKDLR